MLLHLLLECRIHIKDQYGNTTSKEVELKQPENCKINKIIFDEIIAENKMDDNEEFESKYYNTYKDINPIKEGSKWYYANKGAEHNLKVRVQNKKYFDQLELEAKNGVQISNIVQTESPITFTLKNEGDGQVVGHEKNETQMIDGLNVIPCKAKSININIYLIKRLGGRAFNVNRSAISAYLKDFMTTINITTNVNFIEKEIDYKEFDINGDGIIFKPDPKNEDFKNEASYLSKYQFDPNVEAFRVIILDNIRIGRPELSENEFVAGYAGTGFRANYDDSDDWQEKESVISSTFAPTGSIKPNMNTTLMHELGHFIFGLSHPFEQFKSQGFTPNDDEKNIMDYTKPNTLTREKERKLKAYQVLEIETKLIGEK